MTGGRIKRLQPYMGNETFMLTGAMASRLSTWIACWPSTAPTAA
jgi:hypothetical protein